MRPSNGENSPKLTFMGWKSLVAVLVRWAMRAPSAVSRGGVMSGCASNLAGGVDPGQQTHGGGFHVALHPGDLPRQKDLGVVQKIEVGRQNTRRVDEGVAVDGAQAHELGLLQARDQAKDPLLGPVLQLGLKAHQVVKRPFPVFGPKLDHRKGLAAGFRVHQAHGLHGAEQERLISPGRHNFHGQAALEVAGRLKRLQGHLLGAR